MSDPKADLLASRDRWKRRAYAFRRGRIEEIAARVGSLLGGAARVHDLQQSRLRWKRRAEKFQAAMHHDQEHIKAIEAEQRRQFQHLQAIRIMADAATGIDRSQQDAREPGALGAVKALVDAFAERQSFRSDVLAGCDIQRGEVLYRQVRVVLGPGLTEDQLALARLEAQRVEDGKAHRLIQAAATDLAEKLVRVRQERDAALTACYKWDCPRRS